MPANEKPWQREDWDLKSEILGLWRDFSLFWIYFWRAGLGGGTAITIKRATNLTPKRRINIHSFSFLERNSINLSICLVLVTPNKTDNLPTHSSFPHQSRLNTVSA